MSIGAVNAAGSVVVSGNRQQVDALAASGAAGAVTVTSLKVSHTFHSPLIDPILYALTEAAAGLPFHEPLIPVVSNLTGRLVEPGELTAPDHGHATRADVVDLAVGLDAQAALPKVLTGPAYEMWFRGRSSCPSRACQGSHSRISHRCLSAST